MTTQYQTLSASNFRDMVHAGKFYYNSDQK